MVTKWQLNLLVWRTMIDLVSQRHEFPIRRDRNVHYLKKLQLNKTLAKQNNFYLYLLFN